MSAPHDAVDDDWCVMPSEVCGQQCEGKNSNMAAS
jgi:hypothetical protein